MEKNSRVTKMEKLIERARLAQLAGKPAVATECLREARAIAEKLEHDNEPTCNHCR